MEECHMLAFKSLRHLHVHSESFRINNEPGIQQELKKLTKQIENKVFHVKYTTIQEVQNNIQSMADQIAEFVVILDIYLFRDVCKTRGKLFACILQEYLCKNEGKRVNMLYHLLMNLGLIMSGCH